MSHPSFEQFYAALADPSKRPLIGLVISDDDAWLLLEDDEWARSYHDDWLALAPIAERVDAAGQRQPDAAPATTSPRRLPSWAFGSLLGAAVLLVLGAVGVGALVIARDGADGDETASESAADAGADRAGETSGERTDQPLPWQEGYEAPYSADDAAAYLAIVEPLFGFEESTGSATSTTDDLSRSYLLIGSSACVSIEAGFAEEQVVGPIVEASAGKLTAAEGQSMLDAAKKYLCR